VAKHVLCALLIALSLTRPALADDATPVVLAGVDAYNRGDIATAFRLLSTEAASGNSDAQVNLGYMYARGQGTAPNQAEALRLYRLSAEKGNGEGMNAVGYKYQFGTGVLPDVGTAIDWYCRAVAQGNPRALNNLAILLDNGNGVARDVAQARDLWRQAAERGNTNSALNLGISLAASGDTSDALAWLRRAAQAGQPAAQRILRDNGYKDAFPPPFDPTAMMIIQPKGQPAGHARICGAPTS
jgi:uncharacterized protein